jgi:hypothetical protein
MALSNAFRKRSVVRMTIAILAISVVAAACSIGSDSSSELSARVGDTDVIGAGGSEEFDSSNDQASTAFKAVAEDGSVVFQATTSQAFDAKIIRDGRLDLRVDVGTFGSNAEQIRVIASDLGGYVSAGETRIEELEDDRYAVGWYTIRIPSDRFDDAVGRIEQLGERVSASLSSQDMTEEYVDLEGRLNYWEQQEAFYSTLMDEATTVNELIAIQGQMQNVLLTIEEIEGRLRYLDSRTDYATLTVGLTEVPSGPVAPPVGTDPGTIEQAFDQAGEVLLATVAFIIVAAAVAIPIGVLVLMLYGVLRLFVAAFRRKETPAEG